MSLAIRVVLVIASFVTLAFIFASIRKSKMRIEDSLFWAGLAVLIMVLSLFPGIASWCSRVLGFQAPFNFVYVFFIFVLLIKCFSMSRQISELETEVKEISQHMAVDRLEHYERKH